MSVMSKAAMPSLCSLAVAALRTSYLVFFYAALDIELYTAICKQAVYEKCRGYSSIMSCRQSTEFLVLKGTFNLKNLQKLNNLADPESSKQIAKNGNLPAWIAWAVLQKRTAQTGYKMEPFGKLVVPFDNELIILESLKQTNSDPFFQKIFKAMRLFQLKARDSTTKLALNLNQLQMFNNCSGLELSKCYAKNENLCLIPFLKELQGNFETGWETEPLKTAAIPLKRQREAIESLTLRISKPFCQTIQQEAKGLLKDSEWKAPEKPTSKTAIVAKGPQSLESPRKGNKTKLLKICHLCQEMISKKKFFDERRFGILKGCECMICYGCIRKATGTSSGAVKGPVWCPACFIKSDTVVSSSCWIESKEKDKFFETFYRNMKVPEMMMGGTDLPTSKDEFCTRGQTMILVN